MKKITNYIVLGSFLACTIVYGQDKKIKKATTDYDEYAYADAINSYEELVEKGYTKEDIYKNLGNANYLNANYDEAADWYSKLFKIENINVDADYMYRYAQSLKSMEEYDASKIWMQKFDVASTADTRAIKFSDSPDYLDKIEKQSGRYDIKNLAINSMASDFAPAFNEDRLVFSTARDSGIVTRNINRWNNKPFLNLYSASPSENGDFNTASRLSNDLNKKTHESSTAFTKDGTTVYFTRNNSENGKFARDTDGVSRLKIYRATLENNEWTNIIALPFNGDAHSTAHPTLSADENTLYFASDMEGSYGESDIFSVAINADGSYGIPQNLGDKINTKSRETFPYITTSNVLYFASDGHPGLGGLDVYATKIDDLKNPFIVNLGKPINSEQDDFSFIINEDTKKGFFASNRDGGQGSDDIYGFTENEEIDLSCNTVVAGLIKDKETGKPLGSAKVSIFDDAGKIVAETVSAVDGTFALDGDCKDGNYKLLASKEDYDNGDTMFAVLSTNDTSGIEVTLDKTIKRAPVGADLVKFLDLEPVYFDLDKADIRDDASITILKVIAYMKAFPDIKVDIQSHTDVKAGTAYNNRLSQRRADNTVTYLIANAIEASRVSGQGFGESKLINTCTTRESCTDEKHQENRRSEFIVRE